MRQIKFRGKNNHGEWYFGGIALDKKYIVDKFTFQMVRPETVGQFTGFYDKDSKEIYEGDVVKFEELPYIVKWNEKRGCFIYENDLTYNSLRNSDICEIVGNIYDSPELFKNLQSEFLKNIR